METILSYVDSIDKHVERIAKVIRCLRRFSVDDDFEAFSLANVKGQISDTLLLRGFKIKEKRITIKLEVEKDLMVEATVIQFFQVLLKLIYNAAEVSKEKFIDIEAKANGKMLQIIIKYSGPGVSQPKT